jgi:hypothetical protein
VYLEGYEDPGSRVPGGGGEIGLQHEYFKFKDLFSTFNKAEITEPDIMKLNKKLRFFKVQNFF